MFDPKQEDCLRLILSACLRDHTSPLKDANYVPAKVIEFQNDPAPLIQNDADRSFHLVSKATEIIDYRLPFLPTEEAAQKELEQAEHYLAEAVELDPNNWDARRMLAIINMDSDDELIAFLNEHVDEIYDEADHFKIDDELLNDMYLSELYLDLAVRPAARWLATLAARQLMAGQYSLCIKTVERSLALDPTDPADIRYTGVFALAKLEQDQELENFYKRYADSYKTATARNKTLDSLPSALAQIDDIKPDAWLLLAQISLAYRKFDFDAASATLQTLIDTYPNAARPLSFMAEFPTGLFARVHVMPGSEDELALAVSEAAPLFQEGMGTPETSSFAWWLGNHELVQQNLTEQDRSMLKEWTERVWGAFNNGASNDDGFGDFGGFGNQDNSDNSDNPSSTPEGGM